MDMKQKIRTQVILTRELVEYIDRVRRLAGESRSAYLRRAAELRLTQREGRRARLKKLAQTMIGSVSLNHHPAWKNKEAIEAWRTALRNEWK